MRKKAIELLRCAADVGSLGEARQALGLTWLGPVHRVALDAMDTVPLYVPVRLACLEAAMRLEES